MVPKSHFGRYAPPHSRPCLWLDPLSRWTPSAPRYTREVDRNVDKPAVDKPAVNKPVVDKPAVDKPAVDKPVVDKPVVNKPAVDKPVVNKPAVDKPAVDKPTNEGGTVPAYKSSALNRHPNNNNGPCCNKVGCLFCVFVVSDAPLPIQSETINTQINSTP